MLTNEQKNPEKIKKLTVNLTIFFINVIHISEDYKPK